MLNLSMNRNREEKDHALSGFDEFRHKNLGKDSSNKFLHVSLESVACFNPKYDLD
jgi:hypothetical protein